MGNSAIAQVNRFKNTGLTEKHQREANTPSGRHGLPNPTMNGMGVRDNIHKAVTSPTPLFFTKRTVLKSPSEPPTADSLISAK